MSTHLAVPDANHEPDADLCKARQLKRNANDSIRYLQMVDVTLGEVTRLLTLAAELAQQAGRDPNPPATRSHLDTELKKILSIINDVFEKTAINGATVFTATGGSGSEGGSFPVDLSVGGTKSSGAYPLKPAIESQTLLTISGIEAAGQTLCSALASVRTLRASLGDSRQQLTALSGVLGIQVENFTAVQTQTRDFTIAEEVVNLTKFQILNQAGHSALGRVSRNSRQILALL